MNKAEKLSQLRIIAGVLRGRKISFETSRNNIRPTPDRVRETLFNWLSSKITHSRCLDLYAGSGILGFESISRGAAQVVFVDRQRNVINLITQQYNILKLAMTVSSDIKIIKSDAQEYLSNEKMPFDIVFVDPPYGYNMIAAVIEILDINNMLNKTGLVYLEMAKDEKLPTLPKGWQVIKNKVASNVAYYLLQVS